MTATAEQDLAFAGPGALADMVRRREVSARELVELFLARIEAINPKLNAFRVVMADEALAAAEKMSEAATAEKPHRPNVRSPASRSRSRTTCRSPASP